MCVSGEKRGPGPSWRGSACIRKVELSGGLPDVSFRRADLANKQSGREVGRHTYQELIQANPIVAALSSSVATLTARDLHLNADLSQIWSFRPLRLSSPLTRNAPGACSKCMQTVSMCGLTCLPSAPVSWGFLDYFSDFSAQNHCQNSLLHYGIPLKYPRCLF